MRTLLRFTAFFVFCFCGVVGNGQVIYTVAGGNGTMDNIRALKTQLLYPAGIAVDSSGNIYFADAGHNLIRKISNSGIITTIAGNGTAGYNGDNIVATTAALNYPTGVAVDAAGNILIADRNNNRIRKVSSSTGLMVTIAGNGIAGSSGDGGVSTSAQLNQPAALCIDGLGNIYFADLNNYKIRKISVAGIISNKAGNGTAGFSGDNSAAISAQLYNPSDVAVDANGNLYIIDNYRVRMISSSGIIKTFAGTGSFSTTSNGDGGQATAAAFWATNVAVDKLGNVYISDLFNSQIRKVVSSGIISTVVGNGISGFSGDGGSATSAQIASPGNLTIDASGNIYLSDFYNSRIRKINNVGIISTIAGNGTNDSSFATSTYLKPYAICIDGTNNLFIADYKNNRIRKVDGAGVITTVAGNGTTGYSGDGGAAISSQINNPRGVTVDSVGNIYIADTYNYRIRKVDKFGIITTIAGSGAAGFSGDGGLAIVAQLTSPFGVAVDGSGNIYFTGNNRVRKIDASGIISTIAGNGSSTYSGDGGPATAAGLSANAVSTDRLGNIFISDNYNSVIRKIDATGKITTVAGNGTYGFSGDGGLATAAQLSADGIVVDKLGNIFLTAIDGYRVRKIDYLTGIITTIAGNGSYGFSGDGGLAVNAQLYAPTGITVDNVGNVYIGDIGNNRIRKICITAQPATTKTADSSNTTTIFDVNNTIALHNGCDAIANLTPNGNNPVLGPISSQVWLDATQNTGYVKRHYQITPSVNPTTSTATVTLFFTQADFDDFNAVNSVKLPQNTTDAAGKANFKIEKRSGVSFDATGSPSTYNGSVLIIDPADSNIVWNNTLTRWEVTFNVTGFSGFFVKTTAVVLPVQWLSIYGQLNNSQIVEINWQVQEQNVSRYEVEKSSDGISFQMIGTLSSVGNGLHNYHFTENIPLNGKAIYRVKQTDIDGKIDFSRAVYLGTTGKTMLYPNPASSNTTLFSSVEMLGGQAFLYDLQGKLLQQITIQQKAQIINLSSFVKGVYMLKLANGQTMKIIKE